MIPSIESTERLHKKLNEVPYFSLEEVSVLTITWNVNGKLETPENLSSLFDCNFSNASQINVVSKPDIIVFNLQEVIELTAGSVVSNELIPASKLERIYKWQEAALEALNRYDNLYDEIGNIDMLGLFMGVYALKPIVPYISDIQLTSLARGLIGTKGALYFHCKIQETCICFINSHLSAHREKVKKRNADYHAIISEKVFHDCHIIDKERHQTLQYDISDSSSKSMKSVHSNSSDLESLKTSNLKSKIALSRKRINALSQRLSTTSQSKATSNNNLRFSKPLEPTINSSNNTSNNDQFSNTSITTISEPSPPEMSEGIDINKALEIEPEIIEDDEEEDDDDEEEDNDNEDNTISTKIIPSIVNGDGIANTNVLEDIECDNIIEERHAELNEDFIGQQSSEDMCGDTIDKSNKSSTANSSVKSFNKRRYVANLINDMLSPTNDLSVTCVEDKDDDNDLSNLQIEHDVPLTYSTSAGAGTRGGVGNLRDTSYHLTSQSDETFKYSADDHDIIIFAGDMNYRIVQEIDIMKVYEYIEEENDKEENDKNDKKNNNFLKLLYFDQLNIEKKSGKIFHDFHEGEITFLPTYQFIAGSNIYDKRAEKKMRCPAWCDRILYRLGKSKEKINNNKMRFFPHSSSISNSRDFTSSHLSQTQSQSGKSATVEEVNNGSSNKFFTQCHEKIKMHSYESIEELIISDHKPVRAAFTISVKRMDYATRELSMIDAMESEFHAFSNVSSFKVSSTLEHTLLTSASAASQFLSPLSSPSPTNNRSQAQKSSFSNSSPPTIDERLSHSQHRRMSKMQNYLNNNSLTSSEQGDITFKFPIAYIEPKIIIFYPSSSDGTSRQVKIKISNERVYGVYFVVEDFSVPDWIQVSSMNGYISSRDSVSITFHFQEDASLNLTNLTENSLSRTVNSQAYDTRSDYNHLGAMMQVKLYSPPPHEISTTSSDTWIVSPIVNESSRNFSISPTFEKTVEEEVTSINANVNIEEENHNNNMTELGVLRQTLTIPVICIS